jgi:hypothetical protein
MNQKQIEAILNSIKLPSEVLYKEYGSNFIVFDINGERFKIEIKKVKK